MRDLIERLEKASGADRELDLALWRMFFPEAADVEARGKIPLPWLHCYTASIDAAVALVERVLPEWNWWLGGIGRAAVDRKDPHSRFEAINPSPAIALCIALLRAKEARAEE